MSGAVCWFGGMGGGGVGAVMTHPSAPSHDQSVCYGHSAEGTIPLTNSALKSIP